ncbi:MAG: ABC transporter permease, partial [Candidatus Glassbacteria bacterium]|nr:ABC transporter permease [Candidatus Glassbacteria bacterium]
MNVIRCIMRKEFLQIFRDPMMGRVIFGIPVVQLFILGYAITFDIDNIPLAVRDADNSVLSRRLLEKVRMSGRFDIVVYEPGQQRLKSYFEDGSAALSLAIPQGFERDVVRGHTPAVQVLVDGVDSNTGSVAHGYLMRILASAWEELAPARASRAGAALLEPRIRVWFNPNLESRYYILPGIMAVLLTMTTTLLTSMGLVREREIGTLEQLSVTPIRPVELMLGKTLPFAVLSLG